MAFDDVQFPPGISYGSRGGPGFNTSIIETDSGAEERVARWAEARHRYDVSESIKRLDDLNTLKIFYYARQGAANGFRFKDHLDFTSAANGRDAHAVDDVEIGVGDASEVNFQLIKKYASGPTTRNRTISKPIASTVLIEVNGVLQTVSTDYTVNATTGVITFTTAPGNTLSIKAGFEFDVPVRFGQGLDDWFDSAIDDFDDGSLSSVPIIEIVDENAPPEDFNYGGGIDSTFGANLQLALADGRVRRLDPTTTGLKVILPATDDLEAGGPYFFIHNVGTESFDLVNSLLTVLATMTTAQTKIVYLSQDSLGVKTWYAF